MTNEKNLSRVVTARGVKIGGGNPISVQSMTNIPAENIAGSVAQVLSLERAGCDIVRLAAPTIESAEVFTAAKNAGARVPLVADIHFDYKIALAAVKAGADKIRINPGNIGEEWKVREVAEASKAAGLPIRIGVNGGSLDKKLLKKYGSPTAEALAESALTEAEVLEGCGFSDIVLSIKSSNVREMVEAARIVRRMSDYPLHLGVTEAGEGDSALIKSAAGIGSLLLDGIGDTIRVSLTDDPIEEVRAGREILRALGLAEAGINVVSCPTCGRTKVGLVDMVRAYKKRIADLDTRGKKLTVAIMGCVVNGPGEAREADFGVAGGDGFVLFFKKGEPQGRIEAHDAVEFLYNETKKYIDET